MQGNDEDDFGLHSLRGCSTSKGLQELTALLETYYCTFAIILNYAHFSEVPTSLVASEAVEAAAVLLALLHLLLLLSFHGIRPLWPLDQKAKVLMGLNFSFCCTLDQKSNFCPKIKFRNVYFNAQKLRLK